MRIDIITVVPELIGGFFEHSILKRAISKQILEVNLINLRDYSENSYKQVDDYQYGGGAGMVMMIEPLAKCIRQLQDNTTYDEIIYLTPDGEKFDQKMANRLSLCGNLILLCGHYKGIDERAREMFITKEISIGDYVLSGGELPAAILVDAIGRLIPGVIGDETSALTDSFQDNLLSPPIYTRPADFEGHSVPDVLLSGNGKEIDDWRYEQAVHRTKKRRPDLIQDE